MGRKKKTEEVIEVKKKRGRPRKNLEAEITKTKKTKNENAATSKTKLSAKQLDELLEELFNDPRFFDPRELDNLNADFNLAFGEKGNGKTTGCLTLFLYCYFRFGYEFVITRRWRDDFTGSRAKTTFNDIVARGIITKMSGGLWDGVAYWQSAWYLTKTDTKKNKVIKDVQPFCWARALTQMEHDNGSQFPQVHRIFFDEFLTTNEIKDEFVLFMKVYDNIKRRKEDFKVFMAGNTVSYVSAYWDGFGINAHKLEQGQIAVFEDSNKGRTVRVAAEYCKDVMQEGEKATIAVFAEKNPKLKMITEGTFEIGTYPRPPKILPKEILMRFFVDADAEYLIMGSLVQQEQNLFLVFNQHTTEIKDENALIFSIDAQTKWNIINSWSSKIKAVQIIKNLISEKKVFYDKNLTGNVLESFWNRFI